MEDAEQIDLIDFSAENDNLIFNLSSPPPSDGNQKEPGSSKVLRDMDTGKGDASQDNDETKQVPELAESEEPQRTRRNGKCNLRKSLAWDNAFFTSAGVLDPEELSSIMRGSGKSEKNLLPGIPEDIRVSSDSISTLESDNLTLENLEVELFEDIRASIQKSCKAVKSCSHTAFEGAANKAIYSPKVDLASANLLKPKPVVRKMMGLQTIGTPKCQPKMSAGLQGSGKSMKPQWSGSQLPKSALVTRESTSAVPKPPKENGKVKSVAPATAKRASMDASRVKADNDNARTVAGRGIQTMKAPVSSIACRALPKPSSSSKSSSLGPSTVPKTQSTRSTTGTNSGSASSDSGVKSPVATVRRKVATRVLNPPSSSSAAKTPSRIASKSKSTSKNSTLSAYLMSSKMSSNISPASSISDWSSASSSSSSVNQRSNESRRSFGSSSCKSLDVDTCSLDRKTDTDNQRADGGGNQGVVLPVKNMRRSVVRTGTASHSPSMRPSGLRMPSPKIGFFDGVKSVCTPNGTLLSSSGLPVVVSKTGAPISGEVGKLPPGKISAALPNIKPVTEKPNSSSSSQEKSQVSTNIDEKVAENYSNSQEVTGEGCDGATCDAITGLGAMMKNNLVNGCKTDEKENVHSGDQVDGLSKHGVDGKADAQIVESLRNSEHMAAIISETTSHISASRTPLAVKNSLSHDASVHFSRASADQVLEKAVVNLPHLEGDYKETITQSSS